MHDPEILTTKFLTGLIRKFRNEQFPLLTMGLFAEKPMRGHHAEWDTETPDRALGELSGGTSSSKPIDGDPVSKQSIEMVKAFFNSTVDEEALIGVRNPGSNELQRIGEDEIGRRVAKLAKKIDRIKEFMMSRAIQGASFTVKIDGQTITIPARVSNTASGSDWSDPSTKILEDIDADLQSIEEVSGYTPAFALCSRECITSIMQNETVGGFFTSTPAGVNYVQTGRVQQFKGLTFVAHNQTYKPTGGSPTRFVDEDKIVYMPAPDRDIAEMWVGSVAVPSSDGRRADEQIGRYSWSDLVKDPVTTKVYGVERFWPTIYQPDAFRVRTWK